MFADAALLRAKHDGEDVIRSSIKDERKAGPYRYRQAVYVSIAVLLS
jgi:hypothetical protein